MAQHCAGGDIGYVPAQDVQVAAARLFPAGEAGAPVPLAPLEGWRAEWLGDQGERVALVRTASEPLVEGAQPQARIVIDARSGQRIADPAAVRPVPWWAKIRFRVGMP